MKKRVTKEQSAQFLDAVSAGKHAAVRQFIDDGVDVNVNIEGKTALQIAARLGLVEIGRELLDAGAKPNMHIAGKAYDSGLGTALNFAVANGKVRFAKLLVARGANPRICDARRRTPAHILLGSLHAVPKSEQGKSLEQIIEQMLDSGLPIDQRCEDGRTILMLAVSSDAGASLVSALLRRGANPLMFDDNGNTPFHMSCWAGRVAEFDAFIAGGVSIDAPNNFGLRPLHLYNMDVSEGSIYAANPDIEARDNLGNTPLAARLSEQFAEATQVSASVLRLLAAGADLDAPNYRGVTPRNIIKTRKLTQVQNYLAALDARNAMANTTAPRVNAAPRKS